MTEKMYTEEDMLKAKDFSFRDGLSHSAPSPETTRRLDALEKDIEKVISSNSILSKISVGALIIIGIWVGTIQSRQLRNIDDISNVVSKYESIDSRVQQNDVAAAEVRAKLVSIEVTLQEIKAAVKGIR